MAAAFPTVLRDPVEDSNTLLVAQRGPGLGRPPAARRSRSCRAGLQALAGTEAGRIEPRLPGGDVYTDDRAPVEWLIDRSILGYAADE